MYKAPELEDVKYFQKKLYRSLNVPESRLESDSAFNIGRSAEISRDEIKFQKALIIVDFAEIS